MAHLEYPKHVYKGDGDERVSKQVQNAEQEALAADEGYEALPSAPQSEAQAQAAAAGIEYLEFPKHVYRGEGEARESIVVKNAEAEAAAAEQGYAALSSAPAADASDDDEKPKPESKSKRKK